MRKLDLEALIKSIAKLSESGKALTSSLNYPIMARLPLLMDMKFQLEVLEIWNCLKIILKLCLCLNSVQT